MQKKIGIITMYQNNNNYGGVLQAYALTKFLNNNNYEAEQICYNPITSSKKTKILTSSLKLKLKNEGSYASIQKIFNYFIIKVKESSVKNIHKFNSASKMIEKRNQNIYEFKTSYIPHSNRIYSDLNINECNKDYDVFITGSDQVWHSQQGQFSKGYWLNFVDKTKTKISYAASLGEQYISHNDYGLIKKMLQGYKSISLREKTSLSKIQEILNYSPTNEKFKNLSRSAKTVLDPVFLLSKEEWSYIKNDKDTSQNKYVFIYFLGKNRKLSSQIYDFCKRNNLEIKRIPCLRKDELFHKKNSLESLCWDCCPKTYLSLISNAEYIFTDSFHTTAFSIIFNKKFLSFPRNYNSLDSRVDDMLETLGLSSRYILPKQQNTNEINKIFKQTEKEYNKVNNTLKYLKKESINFLIDSI